MGKKKKELDITELKTSFGTDITEGVVSLILEQEAVHGREFGIDVTLHVIAQLTSTLVYNVVNESKSGKGVKNVDYEVIKLSIEKVISEAFVSAYQAETGQLEDFYCIINKVPEPANKLPC